MNQDKPRLLVTRRMPDRVTARIKRDYQATLNTDDVIMSAHELVEACAGHAGIICCGSEKFNAELIARLPTSVRIVSTFSVGYEHIDVEAAKGRGITVTNTPDVLTDATADVAMLCLLAAARRGSEGDRLVRNGHWYSWYTTMMVGTHLGGKRLGIYGMGRIGRAVAQRARGFNMQIHYHNRSRLSAELELGATYYDSAESLLPNCDFLSINAPSTPETVKFLNAERIALLPDGAVVANTARGNMVDDEALIAALKSGKVAAAGLDVFDGEPRINEGYMALDNTFLLPHLGSASVETRDDMGFCCLDNMDAFFAGRPCPSPL
ncbi:MAG: lactate dehydrogenase-like 2-hydroxyacid dehydrogenase [Gammaproteobacteria bacterium]|jgi:lactate dehydrogenase-like 2-hydroxyacid dehydrogenase